ncbi:MAG: hypothetical protein WBA51_16380 [Erythrobacter sp.]
MRDEEGEKPEYPDPREEDIMAGDRRISRPDVSLPDWYVSDASYRPIPIAWFTAAILMQTVIMAALFFILLGASGWITIALCGLTSLGIGFWSWDRGIATAATGWKVAMIVVMGMQFALITLGVSDRL